MREQITPFEFLCFILTQNDTVSVDEIKQIMGNFTELDVTKNGLLEQSDVDEWLRWGRKGKTHRGSLHQFLVGHQREIAQFSGSKSYKRPTLPDYLINLIIVDCDSLLCGSNPL